MLRNLFVFCLCLLAAPAIPAHAEYSARSMYRKPPAQTPRLPVQYNASLLGPPLRTACRTDNQSTYVRDVVRATLDKGVLTIYFPTSPAFHLDVELTVREGFYTVTLKRVPLNGSSSLTQTVNKATLVLDKPHYAVGDVLRGYLDLECTETYAAKKQPGRPSEKNAKTDSYTYYLKGPLSAVVRPSGFNPQDEKNIATYTTLDLAMNELSYAGGGDELRFSPDGTYAVKGLREPTRFPEYETDAAGVLHFDFDAPGVFNAFSPLFVEEEEKTDHAAPNPLLDAERKRLFVDLETPGLTMWEVGWCVGPETFYGTNCEEYLFMWFVRSGDDWKRVGYKKWSIQTLWPEEAPQSDAQEG